MPKVYLAGGISGLSFEDSYSWREQVSEDLKDLYGIEGINPLRGKEFLKKLVVIPAMFETTKPLSTSRGIFTRDTNDVRRSDAVLVNFTGATHVSIGTVMEMAIAHEHRIPIVVVVEDFNTIHDHPFVNECSDYVVADVGEAVDILGTLV